MLIEQHFRTNLAVFRRYINTEADRVPVVMDIISEWGIQTIKDVKGPRSQCRRCGFNPWRCRRCGFEFLGFDLLEEELSTHSSIPAWKIPWTEEPGGPQSVGSQRVRRDWAANTFTSIRTWWDNTGDFTGGAVVKESAHQCRRLKMWVCSLGQEDSLE